MQGCEVVSETCREVVSVQRSIAKELLKHNPRVSAGVGELPPRWLNSLLKH